MDKFDNGGYDNGGRTSRNIILEDAPKFDNGGSSHRNITWKDAPKFDNGGSSYRNIICEDAPKFDNGGSSYHNLTWEDALKFDNGGSSYHNLTWEDALKFDNGGNSCHNITWEDVLKFNNGGSNRHNITREDAYKFDNGGSSNNIWEDRQWTHLFQYTNADTQASLMLPVEATQHHQQLSHGVTKIEPGRVEFPTHLVDVPLHNGSSSLSVPPHATWPVQQNNTWGQVQRTPQYNNGAFLNVHEHSLNPAAQVLPTLPAGFTQHYKPLAQIESGRVTLPAHPVDVPVQNGDSSLVVRRQRAPRNTWTAKHFVISMSFLVGLQIYGKGNWKDISRYAVKTRTLSQVASHAQKYYERQNIPKEERKRKSIHDITLPDRDLPIQNLPEMQPQQQQMLECYPPDNIHASSDEWNNIHRGLM
ncbi:Transcription factor SRM1, partial [Mucuna pruriens]